MKALLLGALFLVLMPFPAQAQEPAPDIVSDPLCFAVRNEAPYKIYGSFITDLYTAPDGSQARHRSNFRLDEPGSTDENGYPADRAEFCSYGPFFPGRKLEMTLRTLIPVFTCKTRIDRGEIVIHGETNLETGTKTWAGCFTE